MALPLPILERLTEANELSDVAMIDLVVKEIRSENSVLAYVLSGIAENFAYDEILALVQISTFKNRV